MLSVRVFLTDYASDVVGRLTWELGAASPLEVFGRAVCFWSHVSDKAPSGVLDHFTPAQLASWACWTGAADVFLEAALRSGFLCRPSVDPHHHKRCTARAPGREGEPARAHPPAELAVHEWDRRMGRCWREFLRGSRPGRVSILLRPPPRGARVGYGPAPRGAPQGASLTEPDAPRGVSPESDAPRGGSSGRPQGGPASGSKPPKWWRAAQKRPAGRSQGVSKSAPRGNPQGASLTGASAPRGVKRRPPPHGRPGKVVVSPPPPPPASRVGGAGSRPQPAASPRGSKGGTAAAGRNPSPRKPSTEELVLRLFAHRHLVDGRSVIPAATLRQAYRARRCPSGQHGGESPAACFLEAWSEFTGSGPQGPAAQEGGAS